MGLGLNYLNFRCLAMAGLSQRGATLSHMVFFSDHTQMPPGRQAQGCQSGQWVLHLTLAGRARFRHPAGDFWTVAGDVLVVEPSVPVAWAVPETAAWEPVWFIFASREHLVPWLQLPVRRPGFRGVSLTGPTQLRRVRRALFKAHGLATGHYPLREELAAAALLEALLWCQPVAAPDRRVLDPRVDAALRYLQQHLRDPVQIPEVVRACRTSRARLLALFRQQVGVPLIRFLEQERMRRAQQLMATGLLPLKQVAADVGYADPKYFARRFRRVTGKPPRTGGPAEP